MTLHHRALSTPHFPPLGWSQDPFLFDLRYHLPFSLSFSTRWATPTSSLAPVDIPEELMKVSSQLQDVSLDVVGEGDPLLSPRVNSETSPPVSPKPVGNERRESHRLSSEPEGEDGSDSSSETDVPQSPSSPKSQVETQSSEDVASSLDFSSSEDDHISQPRHAGVQSSPAMISPKTKPRVPGWNTSSAKGSN